MVLGQTGKRETLIPAKTSRVLFLALLGLFIAVLTLIGAYLVRGSFTGEPEPQSEQSEDKPEEEIEPEDELPILPEPISFQTVVDEWTNSVDGDNSVLIYDIERDEVAGEYNADESYNTASLYKLFVVYEGYRRIASHEWSADEIIGNTGYDLATCLDLAIRESYSPCAETIWAMIGRTELDDIIVNDYGITNSDISHLTSNPKDILKIMLMFYKHELALDAATLGRMKDSFLNQPITTYNWRQGLPSGFSKANVYNKVGWNYNGSYWTIYHDAAIVEFPEDDRHFIVIVMTGKVPFQKIRDFGTMLENYY